MLRLAVVCAALLAISIASVACFRAAYRKMHAQNRLLSAVFIVMGLASAAPIVMVGIAAIKLLLDRQQGMSFYLPEKLQACRAAGG
jgi:hypothetical protein